MTHAAIAKQTQKAPAPAPQQTTKKVANPLNDWLDEAQRDIDQERFRSRRRTIAEGDQRENPTSPIHIFS